mmetsp:Transcript_29690/g.81285  ORF Transcript_29690/g.81285 Transcript_29690/m.81285 type:complete len:392 (+) Transcript_29690:93-1268(+)
MTRAVGKARAVRARRGRFTRPPPAPATPAPEHQAFALGFALAFFAGGFGASSSQSSLAQSSGSFAAFLAAFGSFVVGPAEGTPSSTHSSSAHSSACFAFLLVGAGFAASSTPAFTLFLVPFSFCLGGAKFSLDGFLLGLAPGSSSSHASASALAFFAFFALGSGAGSSSIASTSPPCSSMISCRSFITLRWARSALTLFHVRALPFFRPLPLPFVFPSFNACFSVPGVAPPCCSVNCSHSFQCGSLHKVAALPTTTSPRRALVIITLSRRQSAKKPTPPMSLHRTALKMMSSFSRPWKLSTDATSRSFEYSSPPILGRMILRNVRTWPLYGVTTPMSWRVSSPSSRQPSTRSSTTLASASFAFDSPSKCSSTSQGKNAAGQVGSGHGMPLG